MKKLIILLALIPCLAAKSQVTYTGALTGADIRKVLDTVAVDTRYSVGKWLSRYSTIAAAITKAKDGDIIRVRPGTYSLSSTMTISKNITLLLDKEAIILLDGSYKGSVITLASSCKIIGGTIRKTGDLNGDPCINITAHNSTIYLQDLTLDQQSTSIYNYNLKASNATVVCENVRFENNNSDPTRCNNGGIGIFASNVTINTSHFIGSILVDSSSTVTLKTDRWWQNASRGRNSDIQNSSTLYLTVRNSAGFYDADPTKMYTGWEMNLAVSSKLFLVNSIWNWRINPGANSYVNINGCNSGAYGRAMIRNNTSYSGGDKQTWIVTNSTVKNIAPPWISSGIETGGSHIFERGSATSLNDTVNLTISNCYLEMGDPLYLTREVLINGNIFQLARGVNASVNNSTLICYGNGTYAYDYCGLGYAYANLDFNNNVCYFHGTAQRALVYPVNNSDTRYTKMTNNSFYFDTNNTFAFCIDNSNAQTATNKTLVFSNNHYYGASAMAQMFQYETAVYLTPTFGTTNYNDYVKKLTAYSINATSSNSDTYTASTGFLDPYENKSLYGSIVSPTDATIVQQNGTNGDTCLMTITYTIPLTSNFLTSGGSQTNIAFSYLNFHLIMERGGNNSTFSVQNVFFKPMYNSSGDVQATTVKVATATAPTISVKSSTTTSAVLQWVNPNGYTMSVAYKAISSYNIASVTLVRQ